ncbi:carbohydrate-binding protein [Paenibacillus sp. KQZ6P-2]|uniref:Carbohydrate-binding protein n=1 Tax=Paenibacillus mangrovi TaxID=2931978 RepID=A0A9X2B566_9BACL|nr:TIM-barrel domain-containing protein [Paenibacillus mangrovi]MCJ8014730.1 carbohydrate-binding protein [Paenibacillus mangrovi]
MRLNRDGIISRVLIILMLSYTLFGSLPVTGYAEEPVPIDPPAAAQTDTEQQEPADPAMPVAEENSEPPASVPESISQTVPTLDLQAQDLTDSISVDLSQEGSIDWVSFGGSGDIGVRTRKNIGAPVIRFSKVIPGSNAYDFNDFIAGFNWSDGKPIETGSNEHKGSSFNEMNGGWQLTVPASTHEMTLKVYGLGWSSKGKIEAYLNDNSVPVSVDEYDTEGERHKPKVYTIKFKGNGGNQSLIVKGTVTGKYNDWGNVAIAAATLTATVSQNAPKWPDGSTLTAADVTGSSAVLSWTPVSENIKHYIIYQDNVEIDRVDSTINSYEVSGLEAGKTYGFKVEAENEDGEISVTGPSVSVQTTRFTYIGKVTGYEMRDDRKTIIFDAAPAKVMINAVSPEIVKVWAEPTGTFDRKYESMAIVNDDLGKVNLSLGDKGDYYEISTGKLLIKLFKDSFRLEYYDLQGNLLLKGKEGKSMGWNAVKEVGVWNELQEGEHFWGLGEKTESFDRKGNKIYQWGVDMWGADQMAPNIGEGRWYGANPHFISSKGYSIYFDNTSRTCFDMGKSEPGTYSFNSLEPAAGGELLYYFIYGPTPKEMVKNFTDITGKPFMPPMWAFGNMQSHYGYTQTDIERVAEMYREKQIPLDVMFSDIEWYEKFCSPDKWNTRNFPDPQAMMNKLNVLDVRLALIDDPNITISADTYPVGDKEGYFIKDMMGKTKTVSWPWGDESGILDFFNPGARQWWGPLHNHLADLGVQAFWTDMNEPARYSTDWRFWNENGKEQGDIEELHNAYAFLHHKTLYDWYKEYTKKRPFILTRSFFTGSQRFASPWSGDINSDWNSMSEQIRLGTGLSLSGFNMWGFDIGGFEGNPTSDQFKRWIELAAFTPTHRFHYATWGKPQEAWEHGAEEVSKKYISQRQRLIPYFYSYTADSVIGTGMEAAPGSDGSGIPLMRAMVLEYPDDSNTFNMDTQFMNGQSFLVAPVTNNSTRKNVYFPKGDWYDYSDGKTLYQGGQSITYDAPIDKLPVFVKAGAIIPMTPPMQYVGEKPVDMMTMDIYPLRNNGVSSFVLYEDDGESFGFENGQYSTTKFENKVESAAEGTKNTFVIHAREQGTKGFTPDPRSYMLQFHNTALQTTAVRQDGAELQRYGSLADLEKAESGWFADPQSLNTYVKLPDNGKETKVELLGKAGSSTVVSYLPVYVTTKIGVLPSLPSMVTAVNDNGLQQAVKVKWASVNKDKYNQVGSFTVEGTVEGIDLKVTAYVDVYQTIAHVEAESYADKKGSFTKEVSSEGGFNLTAISNGDYAVYKNVDLKKGATKFEARIAAKNRGGNIEVRLDRLDGPLVATLNVPSTGGWQNWETLSTNLSGASGVHDVYLVFTAGYNLNWFRFVDYPLTVQSIPPIDVITITGVAPQLPEQVTVVYRDGSTAELTVTWDKVDPSSYENPGKFKVEGTVQGADLKAVANITVGDSHNQFIVAATFNLNKLEAGKMLNADVTVKNNSNHSDSILIVTALYNQNDEIVNISSLPKKIGRDQSAMYTAGFKLPESIQGCRVKVFVYDGESLLTTSKKLLSNELVLE